MKIKNILFLLSLFLIVLLPGTTFSENKILIIDKEYQEKSLLNHVYIFEDAQRNHSIYNVIQQNNLFKLNTEKNLNFGQTNSGFWIKFTIRNNSSVQTNLRLSIENPELCELEFYEVQDSLSHQIITRKIITGKEKSFNSREYYHRDFIFSIRPKPGKNYTYYIYAYNDGDAIFFPLKLQDNKAFAESDYQDLFFDGLSFGLLLFIILFNLFLFVILRKKLYLYYGFYVFSMGLWLFTLEGLSFQFFWTEHIWLSLHFIISSIPFIGFFFLIFNQTFLKTKYFTPTLNKIINVYKILFCTVFIFTFFDYPTLLFATIACSILISTSLVFVFISAFVIAIKKHIPAYYLIVAMSFTWAGVLLYQLRDIGFISPDNFFAAEGIKIGLVAECMVIALAIVDSFRREQKEAQTKLTIQKKEIDIKNKELEEINKELEKLSIVASKTDNCVLIFDTKANIEWVNEGFTKLFGLSQNELIKRMSISNDNIIFNNLKKYFNDCLDNKQTIAFETQFHDLNKKNIWIYATLTPIINNNGNIIKIIGIGSDITKLKEVETELIKAKEKAEEADHLKTSFLANMSHEIRTPLNVIMGFANLLKSPELSGDERNEYFTYVKSSINNLTRLIGDIIDISKIEAKQISIELNECFINNVLAELYVTYTNSLNSKKENINLILNTVNADKKFCILTDSNRIKQILINLLDNALKFTEKGTIEFGYKFINGHAAAQNAMIEFYVQDSGMGIDKNNQTLIFERFRKIEDNKRKLFRGTGLGLTISKNLTELLGGEIRVESEPNTGSTFYFTIPFIEIKNFSNKNSEDQNKSPEEYNWKNKTILIAEDELLNYKFLEVLLKPTQSKILRATTGIEAVNICKLNDQIDLILMDVRMPEMDGYEATREIKKFRNDLPIIAQTAYAMDGEKYESLNAGCDDFITKPVNWQVLFEIINKHIG